MTIRTISQLQEQETTNNEQFFEISQPGNNGNYVSRKIRYGTVRDNMEVEISSNIADTYKMNDETGPISVKDLKEEIKEIHNKETDFWERKTFKTVPRCDSAYNEVTIDPDGYSIPNVNYVKQLILDTGMEFTPNSVVMADPDNENNFTQDNEEEFLHFHIDAGGRDSSKWINDETGEEDGPQKCNRSGNLVIYGWLADNGNIRAQDAWVGLYGLINVRNDDGTFQQKWVLLQLQPWMVGNRSSIMQYVSFNIAVKEGLMLKIKTGFQVNGTNTGLQQPNSLTFDRNEPNTFVGYIVGNLD